MGERSKGLAKMGSVVLFQHPLQTLKLTIYYRRVLEDAFQPFLADQINGLTCYLGALGCTGNILTLLVKSAGSRNSWMSGVVLCMGWVEDSTALRLHPCIFITDLSNFLCQSSLVLCRLGCSSGWWGTSRVVLPSVRVKCFILAKFSQFSICALLAEEQTG